MTKIQLTGNTDAITFSLWLISNSYQLYFPYYLNPLSCLFQLPISLFKIFIFAQITAPISYLVSLALFSSSFAMWPKWSFHLTQQFPHSFVILDFVHISGNVQMTPLSLPPIHLIPISSISMVLFAVLLSFIRLYSLCV